MNGRQAAKAAAKKIEDMMVTLGYNTLDIRDYNRCILHMIDGGSPCDFCEDIHECQLEANGNKGCGEWVLHSQPAWDTQRSVSKEDDDDSKGIYGSNQES